MRHEAATRWTIIAGISLVFVLTGSLRTASAATLLTAANYLSSQQANQTAGVQHYLFFTPATNHPGATNNIRLVYPQSPVGTWCRTAGSDLGAVGVVDPFGTTEGATPLPGTISADCTIGNGTTTFDTITVTNVGPLSAGVKYGVHITDPGTAKLGTPPPADSIWQVLTTNDGAVDVDTKLFYAATVPSDQLSITANVVATVPPGPGNPGLQFIGLAAPSGQLNVTRDGVTISSVPVGVDATFDVTLTNQPTGQHIYVISATDRDQRSLTSLTFALNLTATSSTTIINGIFLGPSITVSPTSVKSGAIITVSGNTAPNSTVSVFVTGTKARNYTVAANTAGQWSAAVATSDLGPGSYSVRARAAVGSSSISEYSATLGFTVLTVAPPPANTPTTPPIIPRAPCSGKTVGDINCDGRVNLSDFSILLFYWLSNDPENARVDSNGDGKVDIIDFSILLSLWTS